VKRCIQHGTWGSYCGPECERLTRIWYEDGRVAIVVDSNASTSPPLTKFVCPRDDCGFVLWTYDLHPNCPRPGHPAMLLATSS
jgi:hypothetical protein